MPGIGIGLLKRRKKSRNLSLEILIPGIRDFYPRDFCKIPGIWDFLSLEYPVNFLQIGEIEKLTASTAILFSSSRC